MPIWPPSTRSFQYNRTCFLRWLNFYTRKINYNNVCLRASWTTIITIREQQTNKKEQQIKRQSRKSQIYTCIFCNGKNQQTDSMDAAKVKTTNFSTFDFTCVKQRRVVWDVVCSQGALDWTVERILLIYLFIFFSSIFSLIHIYWSISCDGRPIKMSGYERYGKKLATELKFNIFFRFLELTIFLWRGAGVQPYKNQIEVNWPTCAYAIQTDWNNIKESRRWRKINKQIKQKHAQYCICSAVWFKLYYIYILKNFSTSAKKLLNKRFHQNNCWIALVNNYKLYILHIETYRLLYNIWDIKFIAPKIKFKSF